MNRINKLFQKKNKKILSIYFTAGYPRINDTFDIIKFAIFDNKVLEIKLSYLFFLHPVTKS